MSEELNSLLGPIFAEFRKIIRDEIKAAATGGTTDGERLLTVEEAAKLLAMSPDWLYRNAKKLPFARKLGPKMLRFSALGIQKYLSTRK